MIKSRHGWLVIHAALIALGHNAQLVIVAIEDIRHGEGVQKQQTVDLCEPLALASAVFRRLQAYHCVLLELEEGGIAHIVARMGLQHEFVSVIA